MIHRKLTEQLVNSLKKVPVVALLGPRQVGKTTLSLEILKNDIGKPVEYMDLELDSNRIKLDDAESYLRTFANKLLIIDEVQLKPDIFKTLRGLIDSRKRAGESATQFLLLGSASRDLLQQTSESLAGRIRYLELNPFSIPEISVLNPLEFSPEKLWFRGGYPQSYLAPDDDESWNWRSDFIATYIERDIPRLGINISAAKMRKFWKMLSHYQGQQINLSALGKSLEVSHTTIRNYLDILTDLHMVRQLQPWSGNTKKRLVKSPKIYIRDSGILHHLLSISDYEALMGNPVSGHSWEGFVVENILGYMSDKWTASYFRTSEQTEIDLILEKPHKEVWAIEIKKSAAPKIRPGFHKACKEISATRKFVVYSGRESFQMSENVTTMGIHEFIQHLEAQT